MKNKLLLMIIMICIIFITACGSNLSKYAGTYKLMYTKYVGDPETAKNRDEWIIILNKDGTGKSNRDGESYNVEWSINGNDVKVIEKYLGISNEYNGTIENGKLDIFNGEKTKDITREAVFNKQ